MVIQLATNAQQQGVNGKTGFFQVPPDREKRPESDRKLTKIDDRRHVCKALPTTGRDSRPPRVEKA
ncbi:hypothetical protein DSCA_26350 [Desulfosarcina alkanivorans]|uniref:Uncharacterized protein n=1 Tax=Desulfosarcina alkanivorans TaxID=571177 RepID=A0A5K7YJZ8_9BACT|nr:hypothetical protein DSCA_26350 [Desulfosarcina alkanivorans]